MVNKWRSRNSKQWNMYKNKIQYIFKLTVSNNRDVLRGFWYLLLILGFNIKDTHPRPKRVFNSYNVLFIIINGILLFSFMWFLNDHLKSYSFNTLVINECFISLFSTIMILCCLGTKMTQLKKFRRVVHTFYTTKKYFSKLLFIYSFIVLGVAKIILKLICSIDFSEEIQLGYNYGWNNGNVIFISVSKFLLEIIPVCVNYAFCAFCQHWKEIISLFITDIKRFPLNSLSQNAVITSLEILLRKNRNIWHGTILLGNAFSNVLIFLNMIQIMNIFSSFKLVFSILKHLVRQNMNTFYSFLQTLCILLPWFIQNQEYPMKWKGLYRIWMN